MKGIAALIICLAALPVLGQTFDAKTAKGVVSCEKRNWPYSDPACDGYALAMAHQYFHEHLEYFEPTPPLSSSGTVFYVMTDVTATTLKCDKYQHFVAAHEEDCSTNMVGCTRHVPDSCEENIHWVTEREWQELTEQLKNLEAEKEKAKQ